jgi:hypothetical protein
MANNRKRIRKFSQTNQNISLEMGSLLVTNPQYIPYQFNDFSVDHVDRMVNINKDCKYGHTPASNIKHTPNSMFLAPVTEEEVLNVTSKLKGKLSAGYNDIPEKIVKQSIQFLKKPLTFIFNLSLSSGTFPHLMKIAKVRPIHKKGQKQEISNYRPISVLPAFSKILEMLIYNRVMSFLKKHNLVSEAQNGFRGKKSTNTAIQTFIEDIQKASDNKRFALGIFLDLTKAFDVI